jgi:membrane dipeptidase
MLTVEGGSGIMGSPEILEEFYNIGIRIFGMTWLSNDLAKSNRVHDDGEEHTGLTDVGRAVVEKGNGLGMIFDVSHISDNSFWQLAELSQNPIIATHSNFRSLCPHSRNLTDDMAKEIRRRGGIIGLNLCRPFVHQEKENQTVDMLLDHLEYGISLVGEEHIGFGFDIDGIDSLPTPLTFDRSIHDQFIESMIHRGYSDGLIRKISEENFLAFLKKYLP